MVGDKVDPGHPNGLFSRIRRQYPALSTTGRRVADLLLRHSGDVSDLITVTSIAKNAGVSEASVARFARTLSYTGFAGFKRALLAEKYVPKESDAATAAPYRGLEYGDTPCDVLGKLFALMRTALDDTVSNLEPAAFTRATELVADARRVIFSAHGGSGNIADNAVTKFLLLGINCGANTHQYTPDALAKHLGPGDVVITVSHTGKTRSVLAAARLARSLSVPVIAVTGNERSAIARASDVHLLTATPETPFGSDSGVTRVAQVAVLDCLAVAAAHHRLKQPAALDASPSRGAPQRDAGP
jgi:DNA-binding MurR/RpiR family transcriptional regulator